MAKTSTIWLVFAGVGMAAMTACITDETNNSSPSCFQGCELAADRLACVAACEGAADSGTGADGSASDAEGEDASGTPDAGPDAGDTDAPPDGTTPDGGSEDGSDDTTATDTTVDPDGGSDTEDDVTEAPIPDRVDLLSCQDTFACMLDSAVLGASTEACIGRAFPDNVAPAEAWLACAEAANCIDPAFPDLVGAQICAQSACSAEFDACTYEIPPLPSCGSVADCLLECGKRDAACRNACYGAEAESNAVANSYEDCENICFAGSERREACVFFSCAYLADACYGAELPADWSCAETLNCIAACGGNGDCESTCRSNDPNRRSRLALQAVEACVAANGCNTGDVELDDLCLLESCTDELSFCRGE